jgi:hypothetical protein
MNANISSRLCIQCTPDGQALAGHHQLRQVRLVVVDCREQCIAETARQVRLGRRVLQSAEYEQMHDDQHFPPAAIIRPRNIGLSFPSSESSKFGKNSISR